MKQLIVLSVSVLLITVPIHAQVSGLVAGGVMDALNDLERTRAGLPSNAQKLFLLGLRFDEPVHASLNQNTVSAASESKAATAIVNEYLDAFRKKDYRRNLQLSGGTAAIERIQADNPKVLWSKLIAEHNARALSCVPEMESYVRTPRQNRNAFMNSSGSCLPGVLRETFLWITPTAQLELLEVRRREGQTQAGGSGVYTAVWFKVSYPSRSDQPSPYLGATKALRETILRYDVLNGLVVNAEHESAGDVEYVSAEVEAVQVQFPLSSALVTGKFDEVKRLLTGTVAVGDLERAFFMAAGDNNNVQLLELMLEKGVNINARNPSGNNALTTVLPEGQLDAAKFLLKRGIDANARDNAGHTVLMEVASGFTPNPKEMMVVLLAGGADPNIADPKGNTPLSMAKQAGMPDLVALLLAAGAKE